MRRVWVFGLIAVLAVSAIVAGSAGYLYLSEGEVSGDVPESEIPEDAYTGPEDLNAGDGNVSSLGWLCGGGSTDVYENYSPRSYEDYDYELANTSNGPAQERYINPHKQGETPKWIPEAEFTLDKYVSRDYYTYEVTKYPNQEPTQEDLDTAWKLYNRTFESAKEKNWFDIDEATSDGYVRTGNHYYNFEYYFSEGQLDHNKPPSLVYYQDPENDTNMILAGVMYEDLRQEGEQIAGPLTVWHYHPHESLKTTGQGIEQLIREEFDNMSGIQNFFVERLGEPVDLEHEDFDFLHSMFDSPEEVQNMIRRDGGISANRSGEMIHVWFVDHPEGPFGTGMSVPKESLTEPEKMSEKEFKKYAMKKYEEKYGS